MMDIQEIERKRNVQERRNKEKNENSTKNTEIKERYLEKKIKRKGNNDSL